jgi:hypothetical protein
VTSWLDRYFSQAVTALLDSSGTVQPSSPLQVTGSGVTLSYSAVTGITTLTFSSGGFAQPVRAATPVALPAYTKVGDIITANSFGALPTIDGVTLSGGDRLLLTQGAAGADNGIYDVTQVGDGSNPFILTRSSDANASDEFTTGMRVPIEDGTIYAESMFVLATDPPITLDVTTLTFVPDSIVPIGVANSVFASDGTANDWSTTPVVVTLRATTALAVGTSFDLEDAEGAIYFANATQDPSGSPSAGALVYASGSQLTVRAPGGLALIDESATLLSIAATGSDFVAIGASPASVGGVRLGIAQGIVWGETVSGPSISQAARTTDAAPQSLTLTPQAPVISATGANRTPGSLIAQLSAPTNGGTDEAFLQVKRGATVVANIGAFLGAPTTYSCIYLGPGLVPDANNYSFLASTSDVYLNAPSGSGVINFLAGNSGRASITSTTLSLTTPNILWNETASSPQLAQSSRTTDAAPQNCVLHAQNAFASATGTNRNGGHVLIKSGVGTAAATVPGKVRIYSDNAGAELELLSIYYSSNCIIEAVSGNLLLRPADANASASCFIRAGITAGNVNVDLLGSGYMTVRTTASAYQRFTVWNGAGVSAGSPISFGSATNNDTESEAAAGLTGTVLNLAAITGGTLTTVAGQAVIYNSAGYLTLQGNSGVQVTGVASSNPNIRCVDSTGALIVKVQALGTSGGLFGTESNHPFDLYSNNTARARVAADGSVALFDTAAEVGSGVKVLALGLVGTAFSTTAANQALLYNDAGVLTLQGDSGVTCYSGTSIAFSAGTTLTLSPGGSTPAKSTLFGKRQQTTTNAATNVTIFTPSQDVNYFVTATAHARKDDGSQVAYYKRGALFKRVSGTLTQVGATIVIDTDFEDDAAWDFTLDTNGTVIRAVVTGNTGDTVDWNIQAEVRQGT